MVGIFDAALARRAGLWSDETNSLRLFDGAGDGLAGLVIESFAGKLLVSTATGGIPGGAREWLAARSAPCYLKRLVQDGKHPPVHLLGPPVDAPFPIRENGLSFEISFAAGYSQGIFLDQRLNRAELRRRIRPGMRVLNTFAYTGAFSVAAAAAGAVTTTLDLSRPYLDWARRNFECNGIDPGAHHFCKGDAFHWLRRFAKTGRTFDGIVLDPPTFSRAEDGTVFRAERDFGRLTALAAGLLRPGGFLLCCTNFRRLGFDRFESMILRDLPRPLRPVRSPMPPDFTDRPYLKSIWLLDS